MVSIEKLLDKNENDFLGEVSPEEKGIYAGISRIGCYFFSVLYRIFKQILLVVLFGIAAFLRGFGKVKAALGKVFGRVPEAIKAPFVRYRKALNAGRTEVNRARSEKGFFAGVLAEFRFLGRVVFGKRGFAVTIFNYALPIVCCVFLFNIVGYATSQPYALKLTVNGNFVGYIEDKTVYTDAEQIISNRINYTGSSSDTVSFTHDYKVDTIGLGSRPLSTYQLADRMLQLIDADIEQGFGMYIGDEYFGTLVDHSRIDETLEGILDKYRTGNETETVSFEKDITFVPGLYLADSFVEEDAIIEKITSFKSVATFYTVVYNDSPYLIAEKVNMTMEELARLNPGFSRATPVYVGDKIKITQDQPFLNVVVTREEHYEEQFKYETEYVQDNTRYVGMNQIRQNGVNGVRAVTANVSYINGVEISRKVISRTITKNPVNQIIAVGTLQRPANSAPGSTVEAGKFIWPVGGSGGYKGYGFAAPGYSNHRGLDIIAPGGTPIYAAESGIVTQINSSGWGGGWGKYVVIRHSNGLSTRYAHCSAIANIYVGQKVTAGQLIAYVGTTGNSTGNHLHFEVMVGSVRVDPIYYLPSHR